MFKALPVLIFLRERAWNIPTVPQKFITAIATPNNLLKEDLSHVAGVHVMAAVETLG